MLPDIHQLFRYTISCLKQMQSQWLVYVYYRNTALLQPIVIFQPGDLVSMVCSAVYVPQHNSTDW